MANLYEALLIVTPEADEEGVNAVIGDLRTAVEGDGGKVLQAGVWQRRKLAYQVGGKKEGIYVLVHADGPSTLPHVLKDRMRLDEAVLRHLVVRLEDQQEEATRKEIAEKGVDDAKAAAQFAAASRRAEAAATAAALSASEAAAASSAVGAADVETDTAAGPEAEAAGTDDAAAGGGVVDTEGDTEAAAGQGDEDAEEVS